MPGTFGRTEQHAGRPRDVARQRSRSRGLISLAMRPDTPYQTSRAAHTIASDHAFRMRVLRSSSAPES
jgi:hypothetical protein